MTKFARLENSFVRLGLGRGQGVENVYFRGGESTTCWNGRLWKSNLGFVFDEKLNNSS